MTFKHSILLRPQRRRTCSLRRGTALIEFAICLVVFIWLTYGMTEWGYLFFIKNTAEGAAREGARAAIPAGATESSVTTAVDAQLEAAGLSVSAFNIITTPTDISTCSVGSDVTVEVQTTWGQVGGAFVYFLGPSKTITGISVMRKEG